MTFEKSYFDAAYGEHYYRRNPRYKWRSFLHEILKYRSSGTLLEVGCGFGPFLAQAHPYFQCTGCDISEYAVEEARRHLPASVHLFTAPLGNIPTGKQFDVVAAFDVLEHIPGHEAAFANAAALLKPDGLFVFVVPVYDGPLGWLVNRLDHDETHLHRRERDFWLKNLPAPFEVIDYTGIWRYFLLNRFYLNAVSRLSRRVTTAIMVFTRKK
jgi:SAM-dependent methyltransferase